MINIHSKKKRCCFYYWTNYYKSNYAAHKKPTLLKPSCESIKESKNIWWSRDERTSASTMSNQKNTGVSLFVYRDNFYSLPIFLLRLHHSVTN